MTQYEIFEKLLKERDIFASQVARAIGVNPSTFTSWKKGKLNLKYDKLKAIAEFLNVSVNVFYGEEYKNELSENETKLLVIFNSLNEEGQRAIMQYAKFIYADNEYSKKSLGYTDEAI